VALRFLSLRFGTIARLFGLWTTVLALAGQVALGAVVPGPEMGEAGRRSLPFTIAICHAGGTTDSDSGAPQPHRQGNCALCPFCLAFAQAATLSSPPLIYFHYEPTQIVALAFVPPARAPPLRHLTTYPTGPPILV